MDETERRRAIQEQYNTDHGITPTSIVKEIDAVMSSVYERDYSTVPLSRDSALDAFHSEGELRAEIAKLEAEMRTAAANLEFERAASIRDRVRKLRGLVPGAVGVQ
jgi:excinuclease ABC subunit B